MPKLYKKTQVRTGAVTDEEWARGDDISVPFYEFARSTKYLLGKKPIKILHDGKHVATLVEPEVKLYACEYCGDTTFNSINFLNSLGKWERLTLCPKCKALFL